MDQHLSMQQAISLLKEEIIDEEKQVWETHITVCHICQQTMRNAQQFLALQGSDLTAPPAGLLDRLTTAFRRKQDKKSEGPSRQANIEFDSWENLVGFGVRGTAQERQLLYNEGHIDLDIQIAASADGQSRMIQGQLLGGYALDQPDDLEGIILRLTESETNAMRRTLTDDYGRFSFTQVSPAPHQIYIELRDKDVVLDIDL